MYMKGDYYAGDYYAGDPGLFGGIAKFVGGVVSATPVGRAISAGVALVRSAAQKPQISATGVNPAAQAQGRIKRTTFGPGGIIYSSTEASFDSGGMGPGPSQGMSLAQCGVVPGMRRSHPNKSTYVTRGGGTSRWPNEIIVHPRGTECVTSRRMNVANARALRRALRRVAGFGKLAKRSRRAVGLAASALGVRRAARKKGR